MKGTDAFCPKTGAPLSEEPHYDERGQPRRAALSGDAATEPEVEGELTAGAARSATAALFNRFRRCHQYHREADQAVYRRAALALRRLKRVATGPEEWDIHVWYALKRRLDDGDHDTGWMDVHAEPRCPGCHGRLVYDAPDDGAVHAHCGTNCTGGQRDRLPEIRETIAGLYARAFDEPVEGGSFLRFRRGRPDSGNS